MPGGEGRYGFGGRGRKLCGVVDIVEGVEEGEGEGVVFPFGACAEGGVLG